MWIWFNRDHNNEVEDRKLYEKVINKFNEYFNSYKNDYSPWLRIGFDGPASRVFDYSLKTKNSKNAITQN